MYKKTEFNNIISQDDYEKYGYYDEDDVEYDLDSLRDFIDEHININNLNNFEDVMTWLQDENGLADFADEYGIPNNDLNILIHQYNDRIEDVVREFFDDDMLDEQKNIKYKKHLNEWDEYDDYYWPDENSEYDEDYTEKYTQDEYDDYDWPDENSEYDDEDYTEKYTLVGIDGNAYSVMGYVSQCMKNEGMSKEEIQNYRKDAMSGDYNNLLLVSQEMIDFLNEQ